MYLITETSEFSKTKLRLLFSDNSFLVIYKGMVDAEKAELTEQEYSEIYKKMLSYAKKRAMSLLLKKNYSVQGLHDRLSEDGYNASIIADVKAFLDSYHYLDDERVAENFVRSYRTSKSRQQTRFLLKKQKLPDEIIDNAIDKFYDNTSEDFEEEFNNELDLIKKLLKKKGMTPEKMQALDFRERQKIAASLYRKGFSSENIKAAINMEDFD